MEGVRVERIKSKKDLRRFIFFPWRVYKDYPNWVPPLVTDMKEKLNRKRNPFFEHAEADLFFAFKNDRLTGRIAAIVDENHNKFHDEKVVFFWSL